LGENYSGIRALADFIRDVTKYQQKAIAKLKETDLCLSLSALCLPHSTFFLPQAPLSDLYWHSNGQASSRSTNLLSPAPSI